MTAQADCEAVKALVKAIYVREQRRKEPLKAIGSVVLTSTFSSRS